MRASVRISVVAALVLLQHGEARASDGYLWRDDGSSLFAAGWQGSQVLTGDPRSKFSAEGLWLEYQKGVARQLSVGVAVTWNRITYLFPSHSDSPMNTVTATVTFQYYLTRSAIQPFVGMGLGGAWRELDSGSATAGRGLGFCADPRVGVLFTLGTGVALNVSAGYQFTTGTPAVNGDATWAVQNPQWFWVGAGMALY